MKFLLPVSVAALTLAACTDSTGPGSSLASRDAKQTDPPFTVSGSLTNHTFTFDDGTFDASDAGTFTVESLTGGFGAAAPDLGSIFNNASNRFIGRLDNHRVNLIVPNGGSAFSVSYDLYIIGSWDGNGKQSGKQYGVDIWENGIACTPNGQIVKSLIRTTFSNQKTVQQAFPHNYGEGGGTNKAGAGAYAADAFGYKNDPSSNTPLFESFGDTWYKLSFTGTNPCGAGASIYLVWTVPNATLQSNYDESWGVDNVVIKTD
jgi:hypothetical protein